MGWTILQSRKPTRLRLAKLEDGKSYFRVHFLLSSFLLSSVALRQTSFHPAKHPVRLSSPIKLIFVVLFLFLCAAD
ncbi:hypothetical protein B0T20DRAFT_409312 [Sordaria brevicollis]|uniref:Uncharacterized protein n=1 Tax=Sordaria brevicollis TaxID=83679 RepID=A0AAE0PFP1_SORBR|nr:hypothetical protein B0T20DRAFT_409312 [Sordaria brevicollis]